MSDASERDRGQATVEFVVTLPLVALVLVGILAVARVGTERVLVQMAAREGARQAVVGADAAAAAAAARAVFADHDADVSVTSETSPRTGDAGAPAGDVVTVTVVRRVRPGVPVIATLLPESIEMHASATMRVER